MNNDITKQSTNGELEHIQPSPGRIPLAVQRPQEGDGAPKSGNDGGTVVALRRAPRFSPNNVDNDLLILQAVADRVAESLGIEVPIIDEEEFCANPIDADIYFSMGRLPETLAILAKKEQEGRTVVNSTAGVRLCSHRSLLDRLMRQWDISMPPLHGNEGYWLKRGDSVTQCEADVVFCQDKEMVKAAMDDFASRGISEVVKSAHVTGDLIKFYGVGDSMFRYFYNDENSDNEDNHYPFNVQALRSEVIRLSRLAHVDVFGGDAIVDKNGNYFIIDFNDWPTFRNCRDEAAEAISLPVAALRSATLPLQEEC